MYKIFSGEKCIIIQKEKVEVKSEKEKLIVFLSSKELHNEYKQFSHSSLLKTLIIVGEEAMIWKTFCSLFSYIEAAGGLVKNENDELLMIYRNVHWDLPK